MKTIALTSPLTVGPNVERVQRRLQVNWTKVNYLQGPIDRAFGPQTARACVRAKYWLGYPGKEQEPIAGDQLLLYLEKQSTLPAAFVSRREARIAQAKKKPLRLKALARAEKDLGMKEHPPESNRCPITERWGIIGPWCNMAVSIWYIDAGSKAFRLHKDWAYVPFFLAAAATGVQGIALIRPEFALPGDIVAFDWDDDSVADHVGLLRTKVRGDGTFDTIEGNTSPTNQSNGGEVMHRDRKLDDVSRYNGHDAFVRVGR